MNLARVPLPLESQGRLRLLVAELRHCFWPQNGLRADSAPRGLLSESGLSRSQPGSLWRGQGLESGNRVHPELGLTLPSTPQSHRAGGGGTGGRQCPFPACHPATLLPPGPVSPAGHLHVSRAATNLENQLHSAQKNLLFLQREHASTLKGLHAEIRRLQQHCTDLTYELTVKSSDQTGDGASRSSELKKRCEDLEAQLKLKEDENTELLKELEQKNAMITVLENTIKERERKYLEELKVKSHKLGVLTSELEQRAGTIAYLTSQLHATKRKLLSAGGTSDGSPAGSPALATPLRGTSAHARAHSTGHRPRSCSTLTKLSDSHTPNSKVGATHIGLDLTPRVSGAAFPEKP
ncbi:PREDICTED: coiled-coil domain-containing protein 92 [Bison bison bison]|uniref:Coiled-coil domain-containing protein 92 n=1 Tax=Bison bison bison TaxID=43346 RepID=A0A6P3HJV6_BISBB|nr:PREDICTED: coiled-coil domain-containing protein 92 [Bison bison bison]